MPRYKNPICTVWWEDAAYSFDDRAPSKISPKINVATGFVVEETDSYINLAFNVSYDKKSTMITPLEGILIPNRMILHFEKIKDLSDYEKN